MFLPWLPSLHFLVVFMMSQDAAKLSELIFMMVWIHWTLVLIHACLNCYAPTYTCLLAHFRTCGLYCSTVKCHWTLVLIHACLNCYAPTNACLLAQICTCGL